MEASSARLLLLCLFFLFLVNSASSDNSDDFKSLLVSFLKKLSPSNPLIDRDLNWTAAADPCNWIGIECNARIQSVRSIALESLDLTGFIDGVLLSHICDSSSLAVLSLKSNSIGGLLPSEIVGCSQLTHIYLSNNSLTGSLPSSLPGLGNLKRLDISHNNFSGEIPNNMSKISGLLSFLANNNRFTGAIPEFDLKNFYEFDVSSNQLSGSLPLHSEKFGASNFAGNSGLCGKPLELECPPPPPPPPTTTATSAKSKKSSGNKFVMVFGYVLFALVLALFLGYGFMKKRKAEGKKRRKSGPHQKGGQLSEKKASKSPSRSEYSINSSAQSSERLLTSLVVLRKNEYSNNELKFEELLRAPAELLGKGRFGSLYKVVIGSGEELAVKRIKDWTMSGEDFQKKMMRMDKATHPNVLPATAFYCSKQEKLVVYEFQKNGSLHSLLHDNTEGRAFTWVSRLNVALGISAGISHMHEHLSLGRTSGPAMAAGHGNLKSSNILLSPSMEPLISEYGLTALATHRHDQKPDSSPPAEPYSPSTDVYDFGIILLELLTGKPSHGFNLGQWVHSVVREEWTVEVFDRSLVGDGDMGDEAMMRLLQVALKCMSNDRPTMAEVASTITRLTDADQ